VAAVVVWLPILPWTQAEQQLRTQVEDAMKSGRIAEGLDLLSAHAQTDFPPQWEPPPRINYGEHSPDILHVMDLMSNRLDASWVRECYREKCEQYVVIYSVQRFYPITPDHPEDPRIRKIRQELAKERWARPNR
jgi:hypothetical protein